MGSTFTGLAFKSVFVARALSVKYGATTTATAASSFEDKILLANEVVSW